MAQLISEDFDLIDAGTPAVNAADAESWNATFRHNGEYRSRGMYDFNLYRTSINRRALKLWDTQWVQMTVMTLVMFGGVASAALADKSTATHATWWVPTLLLWAAAIAFKKAVITPHRFDAAQYAQDLWCGYRRCLGKLESAAGDHDDLVRVLRERRAVLVSALEELSARLRRIGQLSDTLEPAARSAALEDYLDTARLATRIVLDAQAATRAALERDRQLEKFTRGARNHDLADLDAAFSEEVAACLGRYADDTDEIARLTTRLGSAPV